MRELNLLTGGIVSPEETFKAINSVISQINDVSKELGDTSGYNASGESKYISSIAGTIGDSSELVPKIPIGETITDFSESLSPVGTNDFYLSLTPISDVSVDSAGKTYVMVNKDNMTDDTHYSIEGRKLLFYKKPNAAFTVRYKGSYPGVSIDGYTPNLYPDPISVASGYQQSSAISKVSQDTYEVEIKPLTRVGDTPIPNGLIPKFGSKYNDIVSPAGTIKAPNGLASVWVLENRRYQKVDDASIYLMDGGRYRFSTKIDLGANPTVVLSLSNWTVANAISFVTDLILNHKHDGAGFDSLISHNNLIERFSERYRSGLKDFGESKYRGDSHPQYLHRDGYQADNPGNFNNAFLGDLLIGSTNDYNLNNNVLANSHKLLFGSVSDGVSLMYDEAFKGMKMFSADNGLKISTHGPQSSVDNLYGTGLEIDGNKIYSTGDKGGVENTLNLESKDGEVKFVSSQGGLSNIESKGIKTENASISGVASVEDNGSIKIGNVLYTNKAGNVEVSADPNASAPPTVSSSIETTYTRLNAKELTPEKLNVASGGKIVFGGDEDSSLTTTNGSLTITGNKPFFVTGSGKNTGIAYKKDPDSTTYANAYTSAENGGIATETDHDFYVEVGSGDIVFSKDSTKIQSALGKEYGFGAIATGGATRVDNLKEFPRANLHAGAGSFYNLSVLASSLQDRRGLNIGDVAAIYATGTDTACPPGWLVVESKNGVVFVDSRAGAIDCQTIVYSDITTGSIKAFGTVSVDKSLGVSENIDSGGIISAKQFNARDKASVGELEVKNTSRFTGSVSMTEELEIGSNLTVGGWIVGKNKLQANELQIDSSSTFGGPITSRSSARFVGAISTEGSISAVGDITTTGRITSENALLENLTASVIKAINTIDARGGLSSSGKIESTGNIETNADIVADGGRFENQVKTTNLIVDKDQTVGGELFVTGRFQSAGTVTLGSDHSDKISVNGETVFNNNKTSFIGLIEASDDASFRAGLTVTGQGTFMSSIIAKAGIDVSGPISSTSTGEFTSISAKENLYVIKDASIGGSVSIEDSARINGGLSVSGDIQLGSTSDDIIISGATHFSNSKNTFSGEVLMTESVTISGNATINSRMNVEGNMKVASNLDVAGVGTIHSLIATGQSEFKGGIAVNKQAQIESLHLTGKAIFDGDITSSGEMYISGGITSSADSSATLGSLNVLGSLHQSDNKVRNQFAGSSTFNNDVDVSGSISVKGALISGSDIAGVRIEGNTVDLIGETSRINANAANLNKITGKTRKVISAIGSKSAGTSLMATQMSAKEFTEMENLYLADSAYAAGDLAIGGTLYVGDLQIIEVPGATQRFDESSTIMNVRARRAKYAP